MCFEGVSPGIAASAMRLRTRARFANVSCVVPLLETRMNSVVSKLRPFKTAAASSGSTLEMKPVFSFSGRRCFESQAECPRSEVGAADTDLDNLFKRFAGGAGDFSFMNFVGKSGDAFKLFAVETTEVAPVGFNGTEAFAPRQLVHYQPLLSGVHHFSREQHFVLFDELLFIGELLQKSQRRFGKGTAGEVECQSSSDGNRAFLDAFDGQFFA